LDARAGRKLCCGDGGLLFTTLPPILAFTGFAYTDMPVAVLVAAAALTFQKWLQRPTPKTSIVCAAAIGLAVLSKFTALLFVPVCCLAITLCWLLLGPKDRPTIRSRLRCAPLFAVALILIVWGGYRFSVGPVRRLFARPEQDIQLLHAPPRVKQVFSKAMDIPLPAPALLKGLAWAFLLNSEHPPSYLFGRIKRGGWWYFFPVVLGVKTPLAVLLLGIFGAFVSIADSVKTRNWKQSVPLACLLLLLLSTMPAKVNYGVRHILCVYPFLSILGGLGAARLWQHRSQLPWWAGRIALVVTLCWLLFSTSRIHPDYAAYFNELAGRHPDRVLLWGCDYDCGQDVGRLAKLTKEYRVEYLSIAVFGNNDFANMELPPFQRLAPDQRVSGWVAASIRYLETGDVTSGGNRPDAFRWILQCQPVARAGTTIYLYHFPCGTTDTMK
jgi:hypothetical protein